MKHNKERLRWQCRRGMLELDMLLEDFLDQQFDNLSADEQECFIQLLQQPDPFLFSWLIGDARPEYIPFIKLINQIKNIS